MLLLERINNLIKTMNPNDFGKKILAEQCRKIDISELLREVKIGLRKSLLASKIETQGLNLTLTGSKTGFGGVRYWFNCPNCNRRVGVVYRHSLTGQLGCRLCLGLDYRKHRYKGMIEGKLGSN